MSEDNSTPKYPSYAKMNADIYDQIYHAKKDYLSEAKQLKQIINEFKQSSGNQLLDVGCGTCSHWPGLKDEFELEGVDKSEQQIAAARKKFPGKNLIVGDMLDFKMNKAYDVIICLFGSIQYVVSLKNLKQAISNMANHLKPGGLLILEPSFLKGKYDADRIWYDYVDKPNLKISRIGRTTEENDKIIINFHYLIARPNGVEYFVEDHILGYYSAEDYKKAILSVDLAIIESIPNNRTMVARKPIQDNETW